MPDLCIGRLVPRLHEVGMGWEFGYKLHYLDFLQCSFKHGRRYEFTDLPTTENLKSFMLRVLMSEVSQVNTSQQLAELQRTHPVLFILVDEGELDPDWRATYMKLAYERILKARYLYTTNPDVLKVKLSPIPSPLTV